MTVIPIPHNLCQKTGSEEITAQFIKHDPDDKTRQGQCKKWKLQANTLYEYTHKSP